MPHYVYILHSVLLDKYYIGESENVEKRLVYHNSDANKIWTRRGRPWQLKGKFQFTSKTNARLAERFIKRQKSKDFIRKIIIEGYLFDQALIPNLVQAG